MLRPAATSWLSSIKRQRTVHLTSPLCPPPPAPAPPQFRHVPGNLYRNKLGLDLDRATNELVGALQGWCEERCCAVAHLAGYE